MRRSTMIGLSILRALFGGSVSAQSPAAPPAADLQRAATAFNASKWPDANAQYAAIAKKYPNFPLATFRVGVTLTELGRGKEAVPYLRQGEKLGVPAPNAAYRLAEAFAVAKMPDSAIAELHRAAAGGLFLPAGTLEGNAHLASLVSHKDWHAVLDEFDAILQPCKHDARFREFDFWVGDWDVRPNGAPAGGPSSRNTITLEENGCVVQEHWVGLGGSTGQSFNLFDRSIGKWRQTWVDNSGGQHDYVGGLVDGNMVLEGTTPAANGALGRVPTKLTLFHVSKDTVRQFSQTSADSGKTWTTAYDLIYVRRAP
jgi:hypothetical protein